VRRTKVGLRTGRDDRPRLGLANDIFEYLEIVNSHQRKTLRSRSAHPKRLRENHNNIRPVAWVSQVN